MNSLVKFDDVPYGEFFTDEIGQLFIKIVDVCDIDNLNYRYNAVVMKSNYNCRGTLSWFVDEHLVTYNRRKNAVHD